MKKQDKGVYIGEQVKSNEGERRPLSCNKANGRSPSLGFISDSSEMSEDEQIRYLADLLFDIFIEQEYGNRD